MITNEDLEKSTSILRELIKKHDELVNLHNTMNEKKPVVKTEVPFYQKEIDEFVKPVLTPFINDTMNKIVAGYQKMCELKDTKFSINECIKKIHSYTTLHNSEIDNPLWKFNYKQDYQTDEITEWSFIQYDKRVSTNANLSKEFSIKVEGGIDKDNNFIIDFDKYSHLNPFSEDKKGEILSELLDYLSNIEKEFCKELISVYNQRISATNKLITENYTIFTKSLAKFYDESKKDDNLEKFSEMNSAMARMTDEKLHYDNVGNIEEYTKNLYETKMKDDTDLDTVLNKIDAFIEKRNNLIEDNDHLQKTLDTVYLRDKKQFIKDIKDFICSDALSMITDMFEKCIEIYKELIPGINLYSLLDRTQNAFLYVKDNAQLSAYGDLLRFDFDQSYKVGWEIPYQSYDIDCWYIPYTKSNNRTTSLINISGTLDNKNDELNLELYNKTPNSKIAGFYMPGQSSSEIINQIKDDLLTYKNGIYEYLNLCIQNNIEDIEAKNSILQDKIDSENEEIER